MTPVAIFAAVYGLSCLSVAALFALWLIDYTRSQRRVREFDRRLMERVRRDHLGARG